MTLHTYTVLIVLFALVLSGCMATGQATKPLTPTEVQVITVVVSKRVIAPKLHNTERRELVLRGIENAKEALKNSAPLDVLNNLGDFLGPENSDVSDLIVVLVKERVDLTAVPEIQGKAYMYSVLDGVSDGLKYKE